MKKWAVFAAMMLLLCTSVPVWARGGGGCLAKGTLVVTPAGAIAIEKLRVGEPVWSFADGKLRKGKVQKLTEVHPDHYLKISAGSETVMLTSEHPVMIGPGEFRIARMLTVGDRVYLMRDGQLHATSIRSIDIIQVKQPAYNLLVMPGGTFVSANIVVHNKGCFLPDSRILKADGTETFISTVRRGDELLAYSPEGNVVHTKVRSVIRHRVGEYILLKTDRQTLRVTAEHPFYLGNGTFKTLEALKVGDTIFSWNGQALSEQRIISLQRIHERVRVFNLETDHPNTFFASRIAVHNKGGGGGCFPAGTTIQTPSGQKTIETLSAGDVVRAVDSGGKVVNTKVDKLFEMYDHIFLVTTDRGMLRTTRDHPIGLADGTFREAGKLKSGDIVLVWNNGVLNPGRVIETVKSEQKALVYNLSVNKPHTFLAADFVVHNKGGSSSRSSSSRSSSSSSHGGSSSDDTVEMIGGIIFWTVSAGLVIGYILVKRRKSLKSENLDYIYSIAEVAPKTAKTEKLLEFLCKQDPSVQPDELKKLAEATFRKLQECWGKREYGSMKSLLMPDLFAQHTSQLQGLKRNHEINRIDNLTIERVALVNIRYTEKPDQREFTALITASARDYYVDDRTKKFLRGDNSPAQFQEFWTFHRSGNHWLLREIEQTGESDILKDENFAEMLTDETIKGICGKTAAKEGEAGPWIEKGTEEKATRIDRLLNFLVQTDKIWDRKYMLERARQIFLKAFLAQESGEPEQITDADLFKDVAENLRSQIKQWQMDGMTVEYRNICIRKTELILVRNFSDPTKDEFTVRISAHAQKVVRKGAHVLSEQPFVTPFEEYWTFGRMDNVWKLKEVLPPAKGEKMITEENVDEDSMHGQLQWYYRKTRAT